MQLLCALTNILRQAFSHHCIIAGKGIKPRNSSYHMKIASKTKVGKISVLRSGNKLSY